MVFSFKESRSPKSQICIFSESFCLDKPEKFHANQYSKAYISLFFPVDEGYYTAKSYDGKPMVPMDRARSETRAEQERKPDRNETWTQTPQTGGHIQINYLVRFCGIFVFYFLPVC